MVDTNFRNWWRLIQEKQWTCNEITRLPRQALSRTPKFYDAHGTPEQWIKEDKNAVKWTKLFCRTVKDNRIRLPLFALAYNLANFLRRLTLPVMLLTDRWQRCARNPSRSERR